MMIKNTNDELPPGTKLKCLISIGVLSKGKIYTTLGSYTYQDEINIQRGIVILSDNHNDVCEYPTEYFITLKDDRDKKLSILLRQ